MLQRIGRYSSMYTQFMVSEHKISGLISENFEKPSILKYLEFFSVKECSS